MDFVDFMHEMRVNRGRLSSEYSVECMQNIYLNGSEDYLLYCMTTKHLGLGSLSWIVDNLDSISQDDFVNEVVSKKLDKKSIMLIATRLYEEQ